MKKGTGAVKPERHISIRVEDDVHWHLKYRAMMAGMTMKQYMTHLIRQDMSREPVREPLAS